MQARDIYKIWYVLELSVLCSKISTRVLLQPKTTFMLVSYNPISDMLTCSITHSTTEKVSSCDTFLLTPSQITKIEEMGFIQSHKGEVK